MIKGIDYMKKWNQALNSIMTTAISLPIFRLIIDYVDLMILRPEAYAVCSAPWYVGGLMYGAIALVVLLICITIKIVIRFAANR